MVTTRAQATRTRAAADKKAVEKKAPATEMNASSGIKKRAAPQKKRTARKPIDIDTFFQKQNIPFYVSGDIEYERAVQSSNLLYRFSRPHWVVLPELPVHVQKTVKQARLKNISLTIKNGGHSYSGSSSTDQGILMDLSRMNKVELDIGAETMKIQGGAVWGHAYKALINGRHDGWYINGGRCPNVGVSGYILGGGLGPFGRSFGMGCDDLKQVTIITANGKSITVKAIDNPKSPKGMLFWALCGAGGGNFGVVVELKMRIRRLQTNDGIVVAGRYTWYPKTDERENVISTMNDFYTTDWPDQVTIDSSWFCDLQQKGGGLGIRFLTYYDGHRHDFEGHINNLVTHKELAHQLTRRSLPEKSTRFLHETLVALWNEETKTSLPLNTSYRIYSSFVIQNDPAIIQKATEIILAELDHFKHSFKGEDGLCQVSFIHSGGRASRRTRSATAFRWREGVYHTYIMMQWNDKWLERDMRGFCKKFKAKLRPFSMNGQAAFINFPDGSLKSDNHEKAYYGNNRQKLQQVKRIWDEDNFFNWAQGIQLPREDEDSPPISPVALADQGRIASLAAEVEEEQASEGEFSVDEEELTDMIAGRQWDTQDTRPQNDFDWLGIHGIPYKWWRENDEDHASWER